MAAGANAAGSCCSAWQREALARMDYLTEARRSLGLMIGGPGAGKSWLLERFRQQRLACRQPVAGVPLATGGRAQILRDALLQLGVQCSGEHSPAELWRRLSQRIVENHHFGPGTVLLLDDVDRSEWAVLIDVLRLLGTESLRPGALTVLAAANVQRIDRIDRRLLERVDLRIDLQPPRTGPHGRSLSLAGDRSSAGP